MATAAGNQATVGCAVEITSTMRQMASGAQVDPYPGLPMPLAPFIVHSTCPLTGAGTKGDEHERNGTVVPDRPDVGGP